MFALNDRLLIIVSSGRIRFVDDTPAPPLHKAVF